MSLELQEPGIWEQSFRICSYDVDFKRNATLESLCRYFLEAAWNHAEALGVGYRHLADQQKFWVLSRLALRVTKCPSWAQPVTLKTWPRAAQSLFALRDFEILDASAARMVAGSSAWLVLDERSRRPQRIDKITMSIQNLPNRIALTDEIEKLPPVEGTAGKTMIHVRYSDIDVNGHVNSARYIGWLLNSYSMAFHQAHQPTNLEVNYLGESRGDDLLKIISREEAELRYLHSIAKKTGGEACRARLGWTSCFSDGNDSRKLLP